MNPASPPQLAIYIDADACPVKAEVYKVARRYGLRVLVVANDWIAVPQEAFIERVVAPGGFDAVDDWIAARAGPGDIVITADIPLAGRCLAAGAAVVGPTGRAFTDGSIGSALADRAIKEHLRAMGEITGGPRAMGPRDKSRFLSTLDETVVRLRRQRT
ncbi:MAG: YaiI/YqxD family protein [Rhodospirillales bacterium]